MPSAFQYLYNKGIEAGDFLAEVEAYGITSRIYMEGKYPEAVIRVIDMVKYDWSRLQLPRIISDMSRGLTIQKLEAKPKTILKYIKKPKDADPVEFTSEGLSLLKRWLLAYGVITPLLAWDELNDLVIDPGPRVYIRVRSIGDAYIPVELEPSQDEATLRGLMEDMSFNEYLLNRVSERTRTPITAYNPRAMATDHEYRLRVMAHGEPIAQDTLAFRKHPSKPWTLGHLINKSISIEDAGRLLLMMLGYKPYSTNGEPRGILIIGEMGSGKTTLTNALLNTMPPWVRVSAIQDVDEFLFIPGRTVQLLNTRASSGLGIQAITKAELIGDAMRSGAGFVFVNEILYPDDAKAWLLAVTSGHGGVTNIHAGDLDDLIMRLEGFGISGASSLIKRSIIVVKMVNRRVTQIYYPEKSDPKYPVPEAFLSGLRSLGEAPDDYTRISGLWEAFEASLIKVHG